MHETSDFFYLITFSYTKYFVHSYTVDVVFTLSYSYMKLCLELPEVATMRFCYHEGANTCINSNYHNVLLCTVEGCSAGMQQSAAG